MDDLENQDNQQSNEAAAEPPPQFVDYGLDI